MNEQQEQIINFLAAFATRPTRSPVLKTPKDHGMDYEDLFFPSSDGVPLEAWYIPAKEQSDKLIIVNHPMPMNRYGFPGHKEPWSQVDNVEINFIRELKHLHNAGYNLLAYDLRNHGNSGTANGGVTGVGRYEWRDCVGAKQFVDAHPQLGKMQVALLSRCMGANSQYEAIHRHPELFENVVSMMSPLPVSMTALMTRMATLQGVEQYLEELDEAQKLLGGLTNAEMGPHPFAPSVKMPVLFVQVKDDPWTTNEDGEKTFELLGSKEKEFFWIETTTRRFEGYNYFGENPDVMLNFFSKHFK